LPTWVKLKKVKSTINSEPKSRRQAMKKIIKTIGLDVHKNSISIGIADEGRDGEVRALGSNR
jgi:type II secretory pathway component HofQ